MTNLSKFLFHNRREDSQKVRRVSLSRGRIIPDGKGSSGNVCKTHVAIECAFVKIRGRTAACFTVLFIILYVVSYFIIQETVSTYLHIWHRIQRWIRFCPYHTYWINICAVNEWNKAITCSLFMFCDHGHSHHPLRRREERCLSLLHTQEPGSHCWLQRSQGRAMALPALFAGDTLVLPL